MKIALIVEGATEKAFLPYLRQFLCTRLGHRMPTLDPLPSRGRLPTGAKLRGLVMKLLQVGRNPADAVIAITDVYTGTNEFESAIDAEQKMLTWVGPCDRFHPIAAQYEFEAWLLPYWERIQALAKHNKAAPASKPEEVNHQKPPSRRIKEIFRMGPTGQHYSKTRDAARILEGQDLSVAVDACPQLKKLVETISRLAIVDPSTLHGFL